MAPNTYQITKCNACKRQDAIYDAKTTLGCWASLCPDCYIKVAIPEESSCMLIKEVI